MVEQVMVYKMKCDACGGYISSAQLSARVFEKDFCGQCACEILSDIDKKPSIDSKEFLEIVDDYKNSYRLPRPGIALC